MLSAIRTNCIMYFYPRSPCGERPSSPAELRRWCEISIHALLAESDHILKPFKVGVLVFLSTLSLRRATRRCARSRQCAAISIHALLAESDALKRAQQPKQPNFYPRSPCGERPASEFLIGSRSQFLSTLSLRRATQILDDTSGATYHFYPRSPCGERPNANLGRHRGNDDFYPRSPCGERPPLTSRMTRRQYFYPRSPCGERR